MENLRVPSKKNTAKRLYLTSLCKEEQRRLAFRAMLAIMYEDTQLADIASLIGMDNALNLMLYFGGSSVKIPKVGALVDCVNSAGVLISLLQEKITIPEASRSIGVPKAKLSKGLEVLKKHYAEVEAREKVVKAKLALNAHNTPKDCSQPCHHPSSF